MVALSKLYLVCFSFKIALGCLLNSRLSGVLSMGVLLLIQVDFTSFEFLNDRSAF
jgi:hypothetical protein